MWFRVFDGVPCDDRVNGNVIQSRGGGNALLICYVFNYLRDSKTFFCQFTRMSFCLASALLSVGVLNADEIANFEPPLGPAFFYLK